MRTYTRVHIRRRSSVTFIVFSVAFPDSSAAADGPSIALSINVVSAHQPAAWHDRPGDPRRNIFGQYLCKTLGSPRRPSFLRDVGNMVIKIDPCFPSNLSKQLTRTTLLRARTRALLVCIDRCYSRQLGNLHKINTEVPGSAPDVNFRAGKQHATRTCLCYIKKVKSEWLQLRATFVIKSSPHIPFVQIRQWAYSYRVSGYRQHYQLIL